MGNDTTKKSELPASTPQVVSPWWNWHDNYEAETSPHPKWIEVSDAGEAAFRE